MDARGHGFDSPSADNERCFLRAVPADKPNCRYVGSTGFPRPTYTPVLAPVAHEFPVTFDTTIADAQVHRRKPTRVEDLSCERFPMEHKYSTFRDLFTNSAYFLRGVLCRKAPRRIGRFPRQTRRGPCRIPLVASSDTCAKCFRFTRSAGETYRSRDDRPRNRRGHKDTDEYGRDDGRSHPPITPGTRLRWVRYGSRTITRRRPEVRKTRWRSATGVDDVSRSLSNMLRLTV